MTLAELSLACYMYAAMTSFDRGYLEFLGETVSAPDLTQQSHRKSLLKFLNSWMCRIKEEDFDDAGRQIEGWYDTIKNKLFPTTTGLLALTDSDLNTAEEAFSGLAARPCCTGKTFASVPTAKVLFALRPNALIPWDNAMLRHFRLNGSAASYRQHLLWARGQLQDLSSECTKRGFVLTDLPTKIERPKSTLPKLIDEYLYVTVTNKFQPRQLIERWEKWSNP
ncbi:MAG: hypothetical protein WAL56_11455 [Candidatus Sulfotelmatobacter sp.]